MSVLVWWTIPVITTLLAGSVLAWLNRTPRADHTSAEVDRFQRFRNALERQIDVDTHADTHDDTAAPRRSD